MDVVQLWMRNLARNLFPFERTTTRGELLFFRIFEALIVLWTLDIVWRWAPSVASYEVVVAPLGMANYIDASLFFNPGMAYGLATALAVSVVLGFMRWARWAYAAALVLFHFAYVARYSLGEISHGSHFPGLAILALALGTALYRAPQAIYRFVFGMLFFLYGLGYACAGFCKLITTGVDWPAALHLKLWMGERMIDVLSSQAVFEPNVFQSFVAAYPAFGSVALTFGFLAEFAGPLMWFERTRPYVLVALILMHLGVEVLLDIFFGHNIYILALLAFPWGRGIDWVLARWPRQHQEHASTEV